MNEHRTNNNTVKSIHVIRNSFHQVSANLLVFLLRAYLENGHDHDDDNDTKKAACQSEEECRKK